MFGYLPVKGSLLIDDKQLPLAGPRQKKRASCRVRGLQLLGQRSHEQGLLLATRCGAAVHGEGTWNGRGVHYFGRRLKRKKIFGVKAETQNLL